MFKVEIDMAVIAGSTESRTGVSRYQHSLHPLKKMKIKKVVFPDRDIFFFSVTV